MHNLEILEILSSAMVTGTKIEIEFPDGKTKKGFPKHQKGLGKFLFCTDINNTNESEELHVSEIKSLREC